jgi:predicted TIM-barrel fold metal-dependent hydrolase
MQVRRQRFSALRIRSWAISIGCLLAAPAVWGTGKPLPKIVDTHIHIYQVTRPGGVPWPRPAAKQLYRDVSPAEYEALARPLGVVGVGVVEASDRFEDNLDVLRRTKGNRLFRFLVANLEIGAPDFEKQLAQLARDPRVVGIRGFLWAPKITLDDTQLAHLRALAARGMTLDLISRRKTNPKAQVLALASAVPQLRIIINHLGGAQGETPSPEWTADMKRLAALPNVYMKFSSFFDLWNPGGGEDQGWQSPKDLAKYQPHFDVLMQAFGPDRLIWGSNGPVCELGGSFADQLAIAEAYLSPLGAAVRDKVMYRNAERFYRRLTPAPPAAPPRRRRPRPSPAAIPPRRGGSGPCRRTRRCRP